MKVKTNELTGAALDWAVNQIEECCDDPHTPFFSTNWSQGGPIIEREKIGIITDPTHERFYGKTNDRMPSFGKGEDGGTTILTSEQIDLVADWLRGDWYRPASH